jgi:hypothetical protein
MEFPYVVLTVPLACVCVGGGGGDQACFSVKILLPSLFDASLHVSVPLTMRQIT